MNLYIKIGSLVTIGFFLQGCHLSSSQEEEQSLYMTQSNKDRVTKQPYYYQQAPQEQETQDIQERRQRYQQEKHYYNAPVPQATSYHVSDESGPVPAKDRDLEWINEQKPGHYTIQMLSDTKKAAVAKTLLKSPKTGGRSAEFGHSDDKQTVYTGVYGTFDSREAAEAAMQKLPDDLKHSAKIEQWQNIQSKVPKTQVKAKEKPAEATDHPKVESTSDEPVAEPKIDPIKE